MDKYSKPSIRKDATSSSLNRPTKRKFVEFKEDDIIHDPGLRKPIDSYDSNIRDQVRMTYLLRGPCQPKEHDFPQTLITGKLRNFRMEWFVDHHWLEYSTSKDAAYYLCCYLFKKVQGSQSGGGVFVLKGYANRKKAKSQFVEHVGAMNSIYNEARRKCENLQNQRQSVAYLLSKQDLASQDSYRIRLTVSLWAARYLLGQGLTFRAHDESKESDNCGNFLELISQSEFLNPELAKHIGPNAPGNCQMLCSDIQKEMVTACASLSVKEIIKDMGDSYYSILVDESRDTSVQEQMAVVLRYVDKHGQVKERFIEIEQVSDTSASSLKKAIDDLFLKHKLSLSKLRGQGYDGASNMSGEFNGLKAKILEEHPSAFFVHCFAHQLQLAVVAIAKNNAYGGDFFNYSAIIVNITIASCKRLDVLKQSHHEKVLSQLESGDITSGTGKNQPTTLVRLGDTRWGSHHTTILRLMTMWTAVLEVLETIKRDGKIGEQRTMARSVQLKMEEYGFVFTMHLMKKILGITNELSQALQRKDQDIVNAMALVGAVKLRLQNLRENEWDLFLKEVNEFCAKNSITVPNMEEFVPTRVRLQPGKVKITYYHHYRVEVCCEVIDLLLQEINDRFSVANSELLLGMACLSPKNCFEAFDHLQLLNLAKLYPLDFSPCELLILKDQLQTYACDVKNSNEFSSVLDIGDLARKMVSTAKHRVFPLVYRLICLAFTLPVSTATVERVFSSMTIIKPDLRNRMGNSFLNDCLVCYVEKKIFKRLENESILKYFQDMKSRRSQLPPIKKVSRNVT